MDLRDTQEVKPAGIHGDLFMECKSEDGVKDGSYDSYLQKWVASFTRQEPAKGKQAQKERP